MIQIHQLIAQAVVLYYLAVGVWGLFLALRRAPFNSAYQGALIISLLLAVGQALVGVILLATGLRPHDDLHYLYGLSLIVALPLLQTLIAQRTISRPLAYGLGSLFMVGLAIRAITTGTP